MSQYYPPYRSSGANIKVELDLSSYAPKTDLKNISYTDVSSFALKTNLASLKTEVDKLDIAACHHPNKSCDHKHCDSGK